MERNELCWCGSGKKYKKCHLMIEEKIAYHADKGEIVPTRDMLKTIPQIEGIQKSADLNTAVLDHVAAHIHAGMSTAEIDKLVYDYTTEHGGIPAPLNYQGFPKSVCTSINNEICHGIPDENIILEEGDIINVDVSTILDGYFSDASRMFMIGKVSERAEKLVRVTQECVELGLAQAKPWNHLGDIADAINSHAKANGYSVVEEIGGHGVGLEFHEEPWVSYVTPKGSEMLLVPGMIFTIEPMINEGSPVIPRAIPAFFSPNLLTSVCATHCAPPDTSNIPPNREPRPISSTIPCKVSPAPFSTVFTRVGTGIPAPSPINRAEINRDNTG